jgi:hypothetical protein
LGTISRSEPNHWVAMIWCAALVAATALWLSGIDDLGLWRSIGVMATRPHFLDWHGVVAASDCAKLGYNVFLQNPCDALQRPHNYGTIWLNVGGFGLTRENQWWTGLLISATFIIASSLALHPRSIKQFIIAFLALASPAVALGIERANVDLIIFVVLLVATYLIARPQGLAKWMGAALCLLLTVAKLYPAVAFASIFWGLPNRRGVLFAVTGFAVAIIAWVLLDLEDVRAVIGVFERPGLGPGYGGPLLGPTNGGSLLYVVLILQQFVPSTLDPVRAGLITFILTYLASLLCARHVCFNDRADALDRVRFIAGLAIAAFAFGVTTNYDYRNIFLLFTLPLLFKLHQDRRGQDPLPRLIISSTLILVIFVLWANALITGVITLAGWLSDSPKLVSSIALAGFLAKHLGHWFLIFLLMLLGNALLFRQWSALAVRVPKALPRVT